MHHHSSSCSHNHTINFQQKQQPQKLRLLLTVLVLIGSLAGVELIVSYFSHSLALMADSGHLFSDCLALGVSVLAAWLSQTRQGQKWEAIAGLFNGMSLLVIAGWIAWEAITRLQAPPVKILSGPMLIVAIASLVINSYSLSLLHSDSHGDLNLKGAFLHVLADAMSALGVIVAAIAIGTWHWLWVDGVVSLAVAVTISISALPLIYQSSSALWQTNPRDDASLHSSTKVI